MATADIVSEAGAIEHSRYDLTQRTLHWAMAAIILTAVALGFWASLLQPGTPTRQFILEIHKSLGMTALVLVAFRLPYRLIRGMPAYREHLSWPVHLAASTVHWGLYALMLYMPVTGYIFSAAGGYSLPWFWLFQWPRLVGRDKSLAHLGAELHGWGAYCIYALLALHIGAVVWHQFVQKDSILARMWPTRS
jgi:cytochrome b561